MTRSFVLAGLLVFTYTSLFASGDTTYTKQEEKVPSKKYYRSLKLALSGTYSAQHNWYADESNQKSIAFLFNADYMHRISTEKFIQFYQFRSALGYIKIIDSLWIKNNDYWRINATWTENESKHFTHTYSVQANSQFLNTPRYIYNYESDISEKTKTAAFFNPGNVTLAYGLNWTFWEYNYINFNFATIKISTRPRFNGYTEPKENEIAKTRNAYIYFEYGLNINTMIGRKINDNVEWENYTYYFMNGISKSQVHLDFMNRITFKFLKYLQLRVDTHIMYEPLFSYKFQYQHDFMLGMVYEMKRSK